MPLKFRENGKTYIIENYRKNIDFGVHFDSNGRSNSAGLRLRGPAGGLVCYAKPSYSYDASGPFSEANGGKPWRYIELSPVYTDSSFGMRWGRRDVTTGATAGADGYNANGAPVALSTDGNGLSNSYKMWAVDQNRSYFSAYNAVEATNTIAYCFGLHAGGYSDWYLPSRGEMYYIWWNLVSDRSSFASGRGADSNRSGTGIATISYWSSSEFSAANAWFQNFDFGNQNNFVKSSSISVRAVRRF